MSTEAMKLALEALEAISTEVVCQSAHHAKKEQHSYFEPCPHVARHDKAITSLRQAIEEAEKQEPPPECQTEAEKTAFAFGWFKALESQPKREPLSIEKLREHWQVAKVLDMTDAEIDYADYVLIARDVEALHGIKGAA